MLVVCNFTPVPRVGYRVGVPHGGYWRELLNSDASEYAGSGMGNLGGVQAEEIPMHGRPFSLRLTRCLRSPRCFSKRPNQTSDSSFQNSGHGCRGGPHTKMSGWELLSSLRIPSALPLCPASRHEVNVRST